MQGLLQRRAAVGASVRPSSGRVSSSRLAALRPRSSRPQRRSSVECKAFFNFFTPKPAAAPAPLIDPRAKPLVEQLIALSTGTDAGAKASPELKEQIAETVTELSRYCIKNPLKSDLLWGEWKVLFASKATAVGGPLRSGAGQAVFSGQNSKQILQAPNTLINDVRYKTLGLLPGYSRQYGEIQPLSGDTFILSITNGEIMAGLGGPVKKDFNIQRKIKILYLDEQIRVALFLPTEGLKDSEAGENASNEDIVFVFERITENAEQEAEPEAGDADGEEDEAPKSAFPFGGRKLEGVATVAERQVRQQMKEQRGGSSRVVAAAPAPAPARPGTQRGRGRQAVEEEEVDPREARRRQQEEERARKIAEVEAKAAEAKAAKEAERERQAAIKALLAQLGEEIKERQAEAKEAARELKEVERATAAGLKEVAGAKARLAEAEGDVAEISAALGEVAAGRKGLEAAAKEAKDVVVAAERVLRARVAAAAPVLARK